MKHAQVTTATPLKRWYDRPFRFYIKTFPRPFISGLFFLLITNALDAVWPLVFKNALDGIQNKYPFSQLSLTFILFFSIMGSLAITRFYWRSKFSRFHLEVQEDLRWKLWDKVTQLSQNYFQKTPVGDIMSHLIQDVQSFRQGVGPGLLILFDGVVIMFFVFPLMLYLNSDWTLKTLVALPLVPFLIWLLNRRIHSLYKVQQDRFAELTSFSQETVSGIRLLKSFAQEDNRLKSYQKVSENFFKDSQKLSFYESLFYPCMELGVSLAAIILLFIAQEDMLNGTATVGTFLAFHRYLTKLMWPLTAVGVGSNYIQKARASFERIRNLLHEENLILEVDHPLELKSWNMIEFQNVSFKYPEQEQWILKNLNFKIHRGERIALIGAVGSGKSTLVQLLLRLYPMNEGQILIDGIPIESFSLISLREHFTLIPQDVFLMSDTILNNLRYGDPKISADESKSVLKQVQLTQEIDSLQDGINSLLGEKGVNLSGGQKQRLALARGLLRRSSFLILDDVLSAVDVETEKALLKTLENPQTQQTILMITHRLTSPMDRVLQLNDKGQLQEISHGG